MNRHPIWCTPEASVADVAQLMADHNCGVIPVCDDGEIVGVITDRDVTCRATAHGSDPCLTQVRSVMTADPYTVSENADINDAIRLMEAHRVRRLPVTRDGCLIGMLSQVDLIRSLQYDRVLELLSAFSARAVIDSRESA